MDGPQAKAGILVNDRVYDCTGLSWGDAQIDLTSVRSILSSWDSAHAQFKQAAETADADLGVPLENVQLGAPILYPGAIFCAGANYWDHFDEMADYMVAQGNPRPERVKSADPFFFIKTVEHSVVPPNAEVVRPAKTNMLDWEAELALIVGREASGISAENVLDIIAGCTILNDLSARDYVIRPNSAFKFDWVPHKCFDGSAPMGPWITPLEFVGDPQNLWIKTWVDDELKQDSNTNLMIHSIAEQIEYLTHRITLRPGDVIATGTPAGVGYPQEQFLNPGDQVRIEIQNCGVLVTNIV